MNNTAERQREAPTSREIFIEAMARIPGPIAIITTGAGERRKGLTASALCSLSADHPSVIVCVNKTASAYDAIVSEGRFGMNIVGKWQKEIAKIFAQKGIDRFSKGTWYQSRNDVPLLAGAPVALACNLVEVVDGFSHSILIGAVDGVSLEDETSTQSSIVWLNRSFCPVS
ncbi:flavin reductase [Rhizobium leguminosarum bv. viciae]|nr:flavin reductase [Rhizobium leguminosarum bv. viciae]